MKLRLENTAETFTLADDPVLVGTHPRADIRRDEKKLHRRHALFAHSLDGWVVHDLQSRKAVTVNGIGVRRQTLVPGDRIEVGPLTLILEADEITDASEETGSDDEHAWMDQILGEEPSKGSFGSRCRLEFNLDGKLYRSVVADSDAIIGTSIRAKIRLPRKGVSSLHCLLSLDNGIWSLYDLKSDHGIRSADKTVTWLSLEDGSAFGIGKFDVRFRLQPDSNEADDGNDLSHDSLGSLSTPGSGILTDAALESVSSTFSDGGFSFSAADEEGVTSALNAQAAQAVELQRTGKADRAVEILLSVCQEAPWVLRYRKLLRQAQIAVADRVPFTGAQIVKRWALWRALCLSARAFEANDDDEALRIAETGLFHDPWNRSLLVLEGLVFERRSLLRHSAWVLATAKKKAPKDGKLNRALAKIMHHLGEYDRSERYWKIVQEAEPESRDVERQIRAVLVQKTLQRGQYQGSDSWENLLEN